MNQTLTQSQEENKKEVREMIMTKYAIFHAFKRPEIDGEKEMESLIDLVADRFTQSNLRVLEKVKEMVEENNKWATENNEYDDEKWKIHYGGYKEAVKNILSDLSTLIEQK